MKQYRIGIIGTENSHAHELTQIFNQPDENGNFAYPDCRVTLVYGDYPEENERVVREFGADAVAESIDHMVKNVDAVMITTRDGKFHYPYAKPFIEAGISAFIDKPFTVDPDETVALIRLAKEKNVPLCGGSTLKFADDITYLADAAKEAGDGLAGGMLSAPLDFESIYSGFFFYSSHLTEMTLKVFGFNPKRVTAVENNGCVCAIVSYDKFNISNHFNNAVYGYNGMIFSKRGNLYKEIDISMCGKNSCEAFVKMLRTGEMAHTYEELAMPVFYMNAVKKSYETKTAVDIECKL